MRRQPSNGDLGESTSGAARLNSPRQRRSVNPYPSQSRVKCSSPLANSSSAPTSPQGLAAVSPLVTAAAATASAPRHPETESPSMVLNIGGLTLSSPSTDCSGRNSVSVCGDTRTFSNVHQPEGYFTPQPVSVHVCFRSFLRFFFFRFSLSRTGFVFVLFWFRVRRCTSRGRRRWVRLGLHDRFSSCNRVR